MRNTHQATAWAALIALSCSAPALAVNADGTSGNYAAAAVAAEISDSSRDADTGLGYQLSFGVPLPIKNGAVEVSFYDVGRDRGIDGKSDYQTSLLVAYVHDLGTYGWTDKGVALKPFVLAGLGGVQEDVLGEKHTHVGVDIGAGTLIGLPWYGLAVRTEARVLSQINDESVPDQDYLIDYRLLLGLQVPLMLATVGSEAPAAVPQPVEACQLSVVDPATGRSDCAADSDHDGVADGVDQCPASEPGALVNAVGCPAVAEPVPAPADPVVPIGEPQAVSFELNSFEIDEASKTKLDNVAALLASDPSLRVEIEGRTDNRGTEAYNIVLGAQRAEAVRQYLLAKGADAARLTTLSIGEFKPVASNDTEDGRRANRSVQFRVIRR
jgi:outer membrane protein OmpA-like peptidoglycan-associated protein